MHAFRLRVRGVRCICFVAIHRVGRIEAKKVHLLRVSGRIIVAIPR